MVERVARNIAKSPDAIAEPRERSGRLRFVIAVAAAVVLAGLLLWQWIGASAVEQEGRADRSALIGEHTRQLDAEATQLLRVAGTLLHAAIAEPVADQRFEVVEERIKPLIREASIMVVAVSDESGVIRIATNHKLEGKRLTDAFPRAPAGDVIEVSHLESSLIAAIPIEHAGAQVGRAVIQLQHAH